MPCHILVLRYGSRFRVDRVLWIRLSVPSPGERVLFSHYLDSNSKRQYWASETSPTLGESGRVSGRVMGACGIWSEAIDHDSSVVRIYKGDVDYLYRDTPNAIYTLSESDVQYPIAFVQEEGSVRHRDFFECAESHRPEAGCWSCRNRRQSYKGILPSG